MKNFKRILLVHFFVMLLVTVKAGSPEEGKVIFSARCGSCHNVNKAMTGPALAGVADRRSEDWIVQFVQSSQALIKKGDKDAVALYQKFNGMIMPDHPDLTADNIKSVLAYIKTATVEESATPFAKPQDKKSNYQPLSLKKDYLYFILYFAVVAIFISVLLFCVRMKDFKKQIS